MYQLERGDIVLTRGSSWLARAIQINQMTRHDKYPAVVNHVAIVSIAGPLHKAQIVEADKKVREGRLIDYHGNDHVFAYRPKNIPSWKLDAIVRRVEAKLGRTYGYLEFFPQQLDHGLFGGAVVLRRLAPFIPGEQCSTLVAQAFYDEGYSFGMPAYAIPPHFISKYCDTEAWREEPPARKYDLILPGLVPNEHLVSEAQ